jgi:hypothetical protein
VKRLSPAKRAHLLAVVQRLPRARVEHAFNQDAVEVYDWRDRGFVVSGLEMLQHGVSPDDVDGLLALARRRRRPWKVYRIRHRVLPLVISGLAELGRRRASA